MSPSVMDTSAKILFVCPSCGYRAKIPQNYLGMSIRCPGCNSAQTVIKPSDKASESTGKTVTITKVAATPLPFTMEEAKQPAAPAVAKAAVTRTTPLPGSLDAVAPPAVPANQAMPSGGAGATVTFTCTACAYRARIPSSYAGRNILCPKCNAAQVAPAIGANTGPSTGTTARIERVATNTPAHGTPALPPASAAPVAAPVDKPVSASAQVEISDKILFTCASCGLRARLPAKYAGNTIKCPKCSTAGTVPLSDAVEAATGTTVSISRAEIAKNAPTAAPAAQKRPSGEIAMPAAAKKQPSGEIAMPPAAKKQPSGEIAMPPAAAAAKTPAPSSAANLEIDMGDLDKGVDTSPFQGQAVIEQKPEAEAPASDEDKLEFDAPAPKPEPKKGGVVKRRGSSSSSNDIPRPVTPAPDRTVTPAPEPAAEAPAPRPAAKKPTPSKPQAETEQNEAITDPEKPAAKAESSASRKPAPSRATRDEPAAPAKRGLPVAWIGAVAVAAVAAVAFAVLWHSVSGELAETNAKLTATSTKLQAESKRADDSAEQNRKLKTDLDKSQQDATELKDQTEKLTKQSADLKTQLDTQKTDLEKQIADLSAKMDEQKRALEAAQQGFKNQKPQK
jgi:hypothetical protein